ncbi:MAG: glycosyltransferase [Opitutaceae bacterium]|nr:glycosyltransferase [Opitutaceae bacterium]
MKRTEQPPVRDHPPAIIFSIAIPAYNEARYLPRLLDSIEIARRCYRGAPGAIEIVVANNGSTDATPRWPPRAAASWWTSPSARLRRPAMVRPGRREVKPCASSMPTRSSTRKRSTRSSA